MTTTEPLLLADPVVRAEIDAVPSFSRFSGVDELAEQATRIAADHPDRATLREIGRSRLGEPLRCLTIAGGERHAVVVGLPHPGEPFGGLTALHLARRLCEDPALRDALDLTWHVVPCADPDGARLNESWFPGPVTPGRYARGFYRPALDQQVEWTFPLDGDGDPDLPEARALKGLLDDVQPVLQCSLHNSEGGGVYYYLSEARPALHPTLAAIAAHLGLPLHAGEAEVPGVVTLAPGVYRLTSGAELREIIATHAGGDLSEWPGGTSSHDYATALGTLTVVCEVPYWVDPQSRDDRPTDVGYGSYLERHAAALERTIGHLTETLDAVDGDLSVDSPFLLAVRDFHAQLGALPSIQRERAATAPERPITRAERWSCEHELRLVRLTVGGMLVRVLDGELAVGHGTVAIRQARARFGARFEEWIADAEANMPDRPEPIGRLVAAQVGTIVAAARSLADGADDAR